MRRYALYRVPALVYTVVICSRRVNGEEERSRINDLFPVCRNLTNDLLTSSEEPRPLRRDLDQCGPCITTLMTAGECCATQNEQGFFVFLVWINLLRECVRFKRVASFGSF